MLTDLRLRPLVPALRVPWQRLRFAGGERGSRLLQFAFNPSCKRVRATKHAPRGPLYLLACLNGLAEIVERRAGVLTSNTTRRVVGQWGGAGGAICEDHFGGGGR